MSASAQAVKAPREALIQDQIRLELGDVRRYPELIVWRNNVGQMIDANGHRVVFGVGGKGAADLLGMWTHASRLAQFVALEIKTDSGKQSPEQKLFEQLVNNKGGVYAVLRSVEDARQWAAGMRSAK